MTKEEKKNRPLTPFVLVVVIIMAVAFVFQMVFPTNLGKYYRTMAKTAKEVSFTVVGPGADGKVYSITSEEKMAELGEVLGDIKMKNKSIADKLTSGNKTVTEFVFRVEAENGSFNGFSIDSDGNVTIGAKYFHLTGDVAKAVDTIMATVEKW